MPTLQVKVEGKNAREVLRSINAELARMGHEAKATGKDVSALRKSVGDMANGLVEAKAALVGMLAASAARWQLGLARDLVGHLKEELILRQRLQGLYRAATGSDAAAARELAFVRAEIARLGLESETALPSYGRLLAAVQNTPAAGEPARVLFMGLAEAQAVLGLSNEKLDNTLTALVQSISKGNLKAEELTGQFAEHLPGGLEIAARAMGMTRAELLKLTSEGKVNGAEFAIAVGRELHKTFGPGADSASQNLQQNLNRMDTAWRDLLRTINELGMGDAIAYGVKTGADALRGLVQIFPHLVIVAARSAEMTAQALWLIADTAEEVSRRVQALYTAASQLPGVGMFFEPARLMFEGIANQGQLAADKLEELGMFAQDLQRRALDLALKGLNPVEASLVKTGTAAKKTEKDLDALKKKLKELLEASRAKSFSALLVQDLGLWKQLDRDLAAVQDKLQRAKEITEDSLTDEQKRNRAIAEANDLRQRGLITEETMLAVLRANADQLGDLTVELTEAQQRQVELVEDGKAVLTDFLRSSLQSGQVEFEELWDSVLELGINTFVKLVSEWLTTEKLMTLITGKEAAKRAAINQAASKSNGAGGGGAGGGLSGFETGSQAAALYSTSSSASAAGLGGALAVVAAFAVVYFGVKSYIAHNRKEWAELTLGGSGGNLSAGFSGGGAGSTKKGYASLMNQLGSVLQGIKGLIAGVGGQFESLEADLVKIGRSGQGKNTKYWVALANGVVQTFGNDAQAAMEFALVEAVKASKTRGLSPLVQQAIKESQATTVEQFQSELAVFSEIANIALPDVVANTRQAYLHFNDLAAALSKLDQTAPSVIQGWKDLIAAQVAGIVEGRDALTGRQRTHAEELALHQKKAALWNAELALIKADLLTRIAEHDAKENDLRIRHGQMTRGGMISEMEIAQGEVFINAKSALLSKEVAVQQTASQAMRAALQAAFDAIKDIAAIDPSEVRLPGRGGGGNRRQDQANLRDEADRIIAGAAPSAVQGVMSMADQIASLRERAERFADEAERVGRAIDALRQTERRRVMDLVNAAVRDPSATGMAESREEIRRRWEEERAANEEALRLTGQLTVARWMLNAAERAEMERLGQEGLQRLAPIDSYVARINEVAEVVRELTANAEAYQLTEEAIQNARATASQDLLLQLQEQIAQASGDEEELARLAELRYDLERLAMLQRINMLEAEAEALGITAEQIAALRAGWEAMPEDRPRAPAPPPPGPDPREQGQGALDQFFERQQREAEERLRSEEALRDALDRLRDTTRDAYLDDRLSPLTDEQRRFALEERLRTLISQASTGTAEERLEAVNQIGPLRDQLLQLVQTMAGSGGYAAYFAQLERWLGPLFGNRPGGSIPLPSGGNSALAPVLGGGSRFVSPSVLPSLGGSPGAPALVVDLRTAALEREVRAMRTDLLNELRRGRETWAQGQSRLQLAADATARNTGRLKLAASDVER